MITVLLPYRKGYVLLERSPYAFFTHMPIHAESKHAFHCRKDVYKKCSQIGISQSFRPIGDKIINHTLYSYVRVITDVDEVQGHEWVYMNSSSLILPQVLVEGIKLMNNVILNTNTNTNNKKDDNITEDKLARIVPVRFNVSA